MTRWVDREGFGGRAASILLQRAWAEYNRFYGETILGRSRHGFRREPYDVLSHAASLLDFSDAIGLGAPESDLSLQGCGGIERV
ncbi:MAG: hypothetical protein ACP5O0_06285 [Acidimicrobiales bacterium]